MGNVVWEITREWGTEAVLNYSEIFLVAEHPDACTGTRGRKLQWGRYDHLISWRTFCHGPSRGVLCHWTTRGGGLVDFEIQSPVSELAKEGFGHRWEARGSVRWFSYLWASLVALTVKNLPAVRETWVWSLGGKIPWRREKLPTPVFWLGEFHALYIVHGLQRVKHNWAIFTFILQQLSLDGETTVNPYFLLNSCWRF